MVGGRGEGVAFIIQFKGGKKALCTAKSKDYTKRRVAMKWYAARVLMLTALFDKDKVLKQYQVTQGSSPGARLGY